MAILKLPRYWTITSTRHDNVERLNRGISAELIRLDPIHLWKQHNGLLYWVVLVGTCMSRSTAQYPLFKTLLFRLSSTHIFSHEDDAGFALSLKNFVAFQTFCASAEGRSSGQ
ncbi:hypothetical protein GQ53DRAFT_743902 [Thozetella sp. PMI_491]|nr:hypothetical protein GQ53DRAFT_743902 [Thozetella sp. PMI_491]